jgi:hypothetical protein
MRQRSLGWIVGSVAVVGAALGACGGSDSSGPSGVACTGNSPDLVGTWTLDTLEFVTAHSGPLYPPDATGSFAFTGDQVNVNLIVKISPTVTDTITGAGQCTLTATKLNINGTGVIGQASGTYTYVHPGSGADTLHASLVSTGNTIRVVVTR